MTPASARAAATRPRAVEHHRGAHRAGAHAHDADAAQVELLAQVPGKTRTGSGFSGDEDAMRLANGGADVRARPVTESKSCAAASHTVFAMNSADSNGRDTSRAPAKVRPPPRRALRLHGCVSFGAMPQPGRSAWMRAIQSARPLVDRLATLLCRKASGLNRNSFWASSPACRHPNQSHGWADTRSLAHPQY
eukprot:596510-Prymnesium_polylepis.1